MLQFVRIILTFGNPQGERSKMFSFMTLNVTLQKSAYYIKFLHHSVKRKAGKIPQWDRRALALMSIKQRKHKMNAVSRACKGHDGD